MAKQAWTSDVSKSAYAGLDFIKAAFCPLDFRAMKFRDHPEYKQLADDDALGCLEVAEPLHYPKPFPFTDSNGHRKTGTQIVTAHFGLAPADFDLFVGLYTYLKRLPELPVDGRIHLTIDFIARQLQLPATCQKDYLRIRSRLFRFSYAKYTNSAFWNPDTKTYDIVNFGFWNIASLSRLTASRRPITLEWDATFFRILKNSKFLAFDYDLYRSLSLALRRFYLIANRDGWNQRDSSIFGADDFAIHQIGYSDKPELAKLRRQKLRRLLSEAEELDLIRPCPKWKSYMQPIRSGGQQSLAVRWSRGPRLRRKADELDRIYTDRIENDALYAQVQELRDEDGKPLSPAMYRKLVSRFGREIMQKHIVVILAQKEQRPGSFEKSEVAAFINRMQHDFPEPDWYQALKRAERVSDFSQSQPNQLSLDLYGTIFRD